MGDQWATAICVEQRVLVDRAACDSESCLALIGSLAHMPKSFHALA